MKQVGGDGARVRTLTEVGKVDFVIGLANVYLFEPVTLVDGTKFMISSVNYDRHSAVAYLDGFPVDPRFPDSSYGYVETCTLSQKLTNTEVNHLQSVFETIRLCRVSAPPGTAVPLSYVMNRGYVLSDDNETHESPARYRDGVVDICDFRELSSAGLAVLAKIDLSRPMSCRPVEVSPL